MRSIGAFAFALLQEFFKSEAIFGNFAKHWHLGLGIAIIVSVALLPKWPGRACRRSGASGCVGRSAFGGVTGQEALNEA